MDNIRESIRQFILENCLPEATIEWNNFASGGDVVQAFGAGSIDIGLAGSSPSTKALSAPLDLDVKVIWIHDVIGEGAHVHAEISIGTLIVRGGTVRGNVVAQEAIELLVPAHVTGNLRAPEITIESCFAFEADAIAEANRRQALYGARRDRYQIKLHVSVTDGVELGSVVQLQLPRLGLAAGKPFVVIGRIDEYVEDTVTLDVWG